MKFIRSHSTGTYNKTPNRGFNIDICNGSGPWVATMDILSDVEMFLAAPDMIDYLIERAEWLNSNMEHYWNAVPHRQELDRILNILRAAGVEVVE